MKNLQPKENLSRRAFARRGIFTLVAVAAAKLGVRPAQAAFGSGNVPTTMTISISPSAPTLAQTISVVATWRRLDGQTAGLSGQAVQFWGGNPTYPAINLGRRVTDSTGTIRFSFPASWLGRGRFVLLADVNPTGCADYWVAAPRPFVAFTVY